jgi:prepilin-type N-terminal cleavage/methylation domain-containing protein
MKSRRKAGERGFSLIELVIVVTISLVLMAGAAVLTQATLQNYRANAAMDSVVSQFRTARQTAISMRRNVQIALTAPNVMQLTILYLPGEVPGPAIQPVFLNDATNGGSQFYGFPSLPDPAPGFSKTSNGINFQQPSGASSWTVMFTSSGELVGTTQTSGFSTVGNNNPINATIVVGNPSVNASARAITVFGATGRVRTYLWTGTAWTQ